MSTFNNQKKRNGASGDFDLNMKLLKGTADIVINFCFLWSISEIAWNQQQICCVCQFCGSYTKVCTPIKYTFTFLLLLWPCFFIGWKLFCGFVYLLTWMSRQCLVFSLILLQSWSNLLYQYSLVDISLKKREASGGGGTPWLKFHLVKP